MPRDSNRTLSPLAPLGRGVRGEGEAPAASQVPLTQPSPPAKPGEGEELDAALYHARPCARSPRCALFRVEFDGTIHELPHGCDVGREVAGDFRAPGTRSRRGRRPAAAAVDRPSADRPGQPDSRKRMASSAASSATDSAGLPRSPRPKNSGGTGACRKITAATVPGVRGLPLFDAGCATRPPRPSIARASRRACRLPTDSGKPRERAEPAGRGQFRAGR